MARRSRVLRALDLVAGIPLVMLLGTLRRRNRKLPEQPRTVGFLTPAAIGDAILVSGIVQDARATWPDARIIFFAGSDNAGAARLIPGVDEVVVVPVTRPGKAVGTVRRHAVDLLIDSGQWARFNAVIAALGSARFTVGFRTAGQRRHFAYDSIVDHSAAVHELENFRALGRAAGMVVGHAPAMRVVTPVDASRLPLGPFAVCHMWSAGMHGWQKEWPPERWESLIVRLASLGLHILVTGSPADAPRAAAFCARAGVNAAQVTNVAGRFSLAELVDALARSAVVVSVNTGVMHIAATVGAATVGLEGPTPARRWGPVGARARSVSSDLPGCGFLDLGWEYAGQRSDCMLGISVEQVAAAVDAAIAGHADLPTHAAAARG